MTTRSDVKVQNADSRRAKESIDRLTATFFGLLSNGGVGPVSLSPMREIFIPEARIIKAVGPLPEIYTVADFFEPRERLLNDGTLVNFEEHEEAEATSIVGNVAQRLSLYGKSGVLHGKPFEVRGVNMMHFVSMPQGWRMCSLIWDDERAGVSLGDVDACAS
jgi:hypothetical protein